MAQSKAPQPAIVIDTREPIDCAYTFDGLPTVRAKLDAGDYSLVGLESRCAVERKTHGDAWGCVGTGRRRFEACLRRLAALDRAAVVIEADLAIFSIPPQHTRLDARMAVGSYISWSCQYRIPIFWCGTRAYAERVTLRFLLAYLKHLSPGPLDSPSGMT